MNKKLNQLLKSSVATLLLVALVGCNLNYTANPTAEVTTEQLIASMPSIIDSQMDNMKSGLEKDEELWAALNSSTRGNSEITGKEIVSYTLEEDSGYDYLNFCYQLNAAQTTNQTDNLMTAASKLMDEESYDNLCIKIDEASEQITQEANEFARSLPKSQLKAFYKDLKTLVVRSTVLLTAGVVYAVIPSGVLWGKVSAAAAISVGAGLVAMTLMSLYERYKFGTTDTNQSFESWLNEMIEQPKADYALAASALAIGQTFDKGPVVAGIVVCVFAAFKAMDAIRTMLLTYNFKA